MTHPIQDMHIDEHETLRFKQNKIVRFLLDAGPFDMNALALMPFDSDDRQQFAQLIGYSVSGFGDLSYAHPETIDEADRLGRQVSSRHTSMDVKLHKTKRGTIEELADVLGLKIVVIKLSVSHNAPNRHFACFPNVQLKKDGMLVSETGNGPTPEAAIDDYAKKISGRLLVIDAMSETRREFYAHLLDPVTRR